MTQQNRLANRLCIILMLLSFSVPTYAQLSLPEIFSNDMILQRGKKLPVWGKASPGASVQVQFMQQVKTTTANSDSSWIVYLDPIKAHATPQELIIRSGITKTFSNVLVGDVWLCSGQSNMEYPLDRSLKPYVGPKRGEDEANIELKRENKSTNIRYLLVEKQLNKYPNLPSKGWFTAVDTTLRNISAIGYFFGKEIEQEVGVPIGIISTSWGGTRIEEWTPESAYAQSAFFKTAYEQGGQKIDGMKPGQKFRSLFLPFVPYAVKGVLWYQGESNAVVEDQATYPQKFKLFIDTWRTLLQDNKLPFYTVQIAPHLYSSRKDAKPHATDLLPEFWEAQAKCLAFPNVDMIIISDLVDDLKDIHPSYKWEVAHRLALQVLKKEYGKRIEAHGPTIAGAKVKGDHVLLRFDHAQKIMSADDKPLSWFSVAGEDGKWYPATAAIQGNYMDVFSEEVKHPKEVRFAWDEKAQPNLVNEARLPARPFKIKL